VLISLPFARDILASDCQCTKTENVSHRRAEIPDCYRLLEETEVVPLLGLQQKYGNLLLRCYEQQHKRIVL
jgi:hypothetical protein